MLADSLAFYQEFFQAQAVKRFFPGGKSSSYEQFYCFSRYGLFSLIHSAVRKGLVILAHICRCGFDTGASSERRKDRPVVVPDKTAVVVSLEQAGYIAPGHFSCPAAIQVQYCPCHS